MVDFANDVADPGIVGEQQDWPFSLLGIRATCSTFAEIIPLIWSLKIVQSVQLEQNRSVLSGLRFLQTSMIHRVHRYSFFSSVECRTPASINEIFIRIYNNIDSTQ